MAIKYVIFKSGYNQRLFHSYTHIAGFYWLGLGIFGYGKNCVIPHPGYT